MLFPLVSLFGKVKNFKFWQKTMDYNVYITDGLIFGSRKKAVRKVYYYKENEKRNLMKLVSVA